MKQKSLLRTIHQITDNLKLDTEQFFDDSFVQFIHKKLLRISEAVYLVTNHINDSEPLKNKIRNRVIEIVDVSVRIKRTKALGQDIVFFNNLNTDILSLVSFLELATIAGVINESNYFLLNRELTFIFDGITNKLKTYSHFDTTMSRSFFDVGFSYPDTKKDENYKGQIIKDKENVSSVEDITIKDNISNNISDFNGISIKHNVNKEESKISSNINYKGQSSKHLLRTIDKTDRTKLIKDSLKNSNGMSIKDISILLPQFGEKTIQRELSKLVSGGFVVKKGEKRWTFYYLSK